MRWINFVCQYGLKLAEVTFLMIGIVLLCLMISPAKTETLKVKVTLVPYYALIFLLFLSLMHNTLFMNCRLYFRHTEPIKKNVCSWCRCCYIQWFGMNMLTCKFTATEDDYAVAKICRAAPVDWPFALIKLCVLAVLGEQTIMEIKKIP